jgi:DNA-binding beta-propeller fold protein YncE
MALRFAIAAATGFLIALGGRLPARSAKAAQKSLPREVARISLPDVVGRIDHLALDTSKSRLFVAAIENGTVEVVDLRQNRRIAHLEGFKEPQGVVFVATVRKLFVTEGGASGVAILDGADLGRVSRIELRDDPDNIRYEPAANRVWVGEGGSGSGALAVFNPGGGEIAEIALDGHPESFRLEARGPRVFVNVPKEHEVEVVDRARREVVTRWRLPCTANFAMALDEDGRRLFVGCRHPAKLAVLDTESGTVVAELDAPADADDIFLDPAQGRVYLSAGAGVVRVYARRESDRFETLGDVSTGPGARTSLFAPESHRLYVAVPRRGSASAAIFVFDTLTR